MAAMARAAQIEAANALAWVSWTTTAATAPLPAWLRGRGLDPAAIARAGHQVGWAGSGWTDLTELLACHRVPASVALAAGLVRQARSGRRFDGFRGRVVLPVRDVVSGRVGGFVARRRDDRDTRAPKYLNSPGNAAFGKVDVLFGAWEARRRLIGDRDSVAGLVVCEGPFDVLNVAAAGAWVAVAPCGTAMTRSQAGWVTALARAFEVPVLLAYDADAAGLVASDRAWDLLVDAGVPSLRLADVPAGLDPGELSTEQLHAAFDPAPRR